MRVRDRQPAARLLRWPNDRGCGAKEGVWSAPRMARNGPETGATAFSEPTRYFPRAGGTRKGAPRPPVADCAGAAPRRRRFGSDWAQRAPAVPGNWLCLRTSAYVY